MNVRVAHVVWAAAAVTLICGVRCAEKEVRCQKYVGLYRDCTCGVQYRDMEERCCSDMECEMPKKWTENLTCPFVCQNGGAFDFTYEHCSCSEGYSGLCCEKETLLCGGTLLDASGLIFVPPNLSNGTRCAWRILTDSYRNIALGALYSTKGPEWGTKVSTSLEYEDASTLLRVHDGRNASASELAMSLTNDGDFHTVYSTDRFMYIEYISQNATVLPFLALQYTTFFKGQKCGPQMNYLHPSGTITSPQHPLNYRPNEDCSWTIRVQPEYQLVITIAMMDMISSPGCQDGDRLVVTTSAIAIATFCGNGTYAPYTIENASTVQLRFTSDQCGEGKGFSLRYNQRKKN